MLKNRYDHNMIPFQKKLLEKDRTIVLGITGGIACGKSLVCQFFRELGATVLSADELAREVVKPGEDTYKMVVAHFGKEILAADGNIDRSRLAEKIFLIPAERQELNRITHPAIGQLADKRISELRQDPTVPLIIYEAPLLFEAKAEERVDLVLVVATTPEQQLERLMQRDKLSQSEALLRIAAQMPLAEKISRADILVENNATRAETLTFIQQIFTELTTLDKKNPPKPGDLRSF